MFRKIVSNLPFSPALVGQLGFYAKRLRKEEATRRLGLVFIALALVVQSLAVFQPPESANASSETDMVSGGIGDSIDNFLKAYDSNIKHLKDTMNYVGVTRAEIASTKFSSLKTGDKLSWGFASKFSYMQGERQHNVTDENGKIVSIVYSRPLKLWGSASTRIDAWIGKSKKFGWFAVMQSCGNLVTDVIPPPPPPPPKKCAVNPQLMADDKNCLPCPGNTNMWAIDKSCTPNIKKSKTAVNTTQGFKNASSITANASDQISYTISIENTGLNTTSMQLNDSLADVSEYAVLVDKGGGTYNEITKVLSWPDITLKPKDKQTRTFAVRLPSTISATARGASDPTSYDCIMTNVFGNSINVNVSCPTTKVVEQVAKELPKTGPTENILFAGIVLVFATYFYARTRQVKKEVHLIRRDVSAGTL